jgi:opacity protein-like surface antigen
MRWCVMLLVGALTLDGVAHAQSAGSSSGDTYVEGVAQSAFGNVTSQSFGIEAGVRIGSDSEVFGEFGRVADVATTEIGAHAQLVANELAQLQSNVSFSVAEPVRFFAAGIKYGVPTSWTLKPYVLAGFGLATVKQDVAFRVGNSDVTSTLSQFGIALGGDLSGSFTRPMVVVGAGAMYPIHGSFFADFQFRYNRIFAPGSAIPIGRAGLGLGFRF